MDRKPLNPPPIDLMDMDYPENSELTPIVDVEAQLRALLTLGGSGDDSESIHPPDDYFSAGHEQSRASVGSNYCSLSALLTRVILLLQANRNPDTNHSDLQAHCRYKPGASPASRKYRVGTSSSRRFSRSD
jgi:hypothetical protein